MSGGKFHRYCRMKGIEGREKKKFRHFLRERKKASARVAPVISEPLPGLKNG